MRISDWSSDVCSSDLLHFHGRCGICGLENPCKCSVPGHHGFGSQCWWRASRAMAPRNTARPVRSEEHTSELQSLMRISYAVFCLKKKKKQATTQTSSKDEISNTRQYTIKYKHQSY